MRVLILLACLLVPASAARAELDVFPLRIAIACTADADGLRRILADKHREAPILEGTMPAGQVVELWASPEGSWTVTAALPEGGLCLLSGGSGLKPAAPKVPEKRT